MMSDSGTVFFPLKTILLIGLVEDQEEVVAPGDLDDPPERLLRIDVAGGVVGIDDEDPDDGLVALHLPLQFVDVRRPVAVGIHPVGVRRKGGVEDLRQQVRGVGRLRHDDPRVDADGAVGAGDRVAQTVEEDDILRRDLRLSAPVDLFREEFAGRVHPLRRGIAVGAVLAQQVGEDLPHPVGNLLPLLDGIADVLPDHLDARPLQPVGHIHDVADLINESAAALGNVESHSGLS